MPRGLSGMAAAVILALSVAVAPAQAGSPAPAAPRDIDVRAADPQGIDASTLAARTTLRRKLGAEGVVTTDPVAGGARVVARTDGLLTGESARGPAAIALAYVRDHRELFGLSDADIAALRPTLRDHTAGGVTNLEWTQTVDGVPAYDSTLAATVTDDGQLVAIHGSAVPGLDLASTAPQLDAARARAIAAGDVGGRPEDATASLTVLGSAKEARLAWRVLAYDAHRRLFDVVVDAQTGDILVRHGLTDDYSAATVFNRYPGSATDATGHLVNLGADPSWLSLSGTTSPASLRGNNAHAYADRGGVNGFDAGEDIAPSSGSDWNFPLTPINAGASCPLFGAVAACTWDGTSETVNRSQATTQLFYYVNTFHDHLAAAPIGFTHASRNFEAVDADGAGPGLGNDAVNAEANDSAGLNNANMTTPPDGSAPRMQMYLFTNPPLNGSDVADVVYHEYTHGLSNRLIGNGSGLTTHQPQSMGEGWSDWYAFDFLVAQGNVTDTGADGDLLNGSYLYPGGSIAGGPPGIRTQALDCSVGSSSPNCPGTPASGPGGDTLGDMGKVNGTDVHADGEIWVETLWDIRKALGPATAEALVTDAMRLSPANPSFLDERNAILAADQAQGGTNAATLWQLFATRGMGYSAATPSSSATSATEAFDLPPLVSHVSAAISDPAPIGDGDGIAEPGETVRITETLHNPNPFALTTVSGLLSGTGGLVVGGLAATWSSPFAAAADATATSPLAVTVPADHVCGEPLALSLQVTTDQGAQVLPFSIPTGGPGTLISPNSSDVPKAIPDNSVTGATSTLTVPGGGLINDLKVRIPSITHTYDADLVITLTAPDGTTVLLVNKRGGSSNNFTNTVLDDGAGTDISGGAAPFTGSFRPEQPLSVLRGRPAGGVWKLKVVDTAAIDVGSIAAWGLDERPAACSTTAAAAPATATGAATAVTPTTATIAGSVDPKGTATDGAFQFGTSASYGAQSPVIPAGSGNGDVPLEQLLAGLQPSTTYHFRAVALRGGTPVAVGADQTFTTGAAPATPPDTATTAATPPTQPTAPKPPPGTTVGGTSSHHGTVRFPKSPTRIYASRARTFTYTLEATRGYSGTVRFTSLRALAAGLRAHARVRIALGATAFPSTRKAERLTVRAKLSKRAWRTLRRMRKIRVRVTVVLDGHTFAGQFVLAAPRPTVRAARG